MCGRVELKHNFGNMMISRLWISIFISVLVYRMYIITAVDESRTLVISNGGIVKLIIGLVMPVELPVGLIWLQNIQFQYPMIDRASQLTYLNLLRKSNNRAMTRDMTYNMLAETWHSFGMNGSACVLRTICDVARYSLFDNGIIGQLLHSVFRPHRTSLEIYKDAMRLGKAGGRCEIDYSHCTSHFLDYFLI